MYHPAVLRRGLLVLLAIGALPAAGAGLTGILRGETLRAGESRTVRVPAVDAPSEAGDESELVLSLDGGRNCRRKGRSG